MSSQAKALIFIHDNKWQKMGGGRRLPWLIDALRLSEILQKPLWLALLQERGTGVRKSSRGDSNKSDN